MTLLANQRAKIANANNIRLLGMVAGHGGGAKLAYSCIFIDPGILSFYSTSFIFYALK